MGKYLIKVESMDHDEVLDSEYVEGVECDGFVVLAHKGDGCKVILHKVSIDTISDMIKADSKLTQAAILAEAKRKIIEMAMKDKAESKVEALKALFDGLR